MASLVTTFASTPDTIQTVTLAGVQYRLRMYWRERLQGWYLDLRELDETAVVLGRRFSVGSGPLTGFLSAEMPDGQLYVQGVDGYEQADLGNELGDALTLWFFTTEEIEAAQSDDTSLVTVTIP